MVFAGWCSNGRRLVLGRSSGSRTFVSSGDGRLVLATVLSYLPACVSVWFNSGGAAQLKALIDLNRSLWPFAGCTFEWWLSRAPP